MDPDEPTSDQPEDEKQEWDFRQRCLNALQPFENRGAQIDALLSGAGFSISDLARLARADDGTIQSWRDDYTSERLPDHLDDVRAITEQLIDHRLMEPSSVGPWFSLPNSTLDGEAPIEAIIKGRFEDVLEAARDDPKWMCLFDGRVRTDISAPRHAESTFELIDRRVGENWDEIRARLNGWFEDFSESGSEDLRRRFQSRRAEQHVGAWWELYIFTLFRRLGYELSVHPDVPGTAGRPDFLAERGGTSFYVEATHVDSGIEDPGRDENREGQIYDLVNQAKSSDFYLNMELEKVGLETPSVHEVVEPIERWLSSLSADQVEADYNRGKPLPSRQISVRDWVMTFEALPIPSESRGKAERILGLYPGSAGFVNDKEKARAALRRKKRRYGDPGRPLVVALLSDSGFFDDEDVGQCLFGSEAIRYVQNDPTVEPRTVRQKDGFWMSDRGPSGRNIAAVLHADGLRPWNFMEMLPTLWLNPWATRELNLDVGLTTGTADNDGNVHIEPGRLSPDELF